MSARRSMVEAVAPGGRVAGFAGPRMRRRGLLLAVGALSGCAWAGASGSQPVVKGAVMYAPPELPAGALLEVTLEDVARADAPSVRIATWTQVDPRPGIEYTLFYDPATVPGHARLTVRARITHGGRLLHTTDRHHPVPIGVSPPPVNLVLRRVSSAP